MRLPRAIGLTAAALTAVLGPPAPVPATAASDTLRVDRTNANCSDGGTGSEFQPYCSIGAAAAAAEPGQTVRIAKGNYAEDLRITRSGTAQAPITFVGDNTELKAASKRPARALTVSGVHDVVFRSLGLGETLIENSQRITLDRDGMYAAEDALTPLLEVGGASRDVALTRNNMTSSQYAAIRVSGGATGTTISDNSVLRATGSPVSVDGAPGTTVTNNTLAYGCGPGISLTGGSTGGNIYNNIVDSHGAVRLDGFRCRDQAVATELLVSADSVPGTTADYNLVRATAEGTPYTWAGRQYRTPAAFNAATGQGRNDLMGDPKLVDAWSIRLKDCTVVDGKPDRSSCSPAIDSAKADAPGVLPSDQFGHPPTDDPFVDNPGPGYLDRGAYEVQDELADNAYLDVDRTQVPYGTQVNFTARVGHQWPSVPLSYAYDFGDGTKETSNSPTVSHIYRAACQCLPELVITAGGGQQVVGGADPMKITEPGPLTANLSATALLPTSASLSAEAPLTVLADAGASVSPWPITVYGFDYGDGQKQNGLIGSSQKHTYKAPGDYRITATVTDNQGRTSSSSQLFHAAYAPSTYTAVKPFRILDTRTDHYPVSSVLPRTLDIPLWGDGRPSLSTGMTAVVLNVTATGATQDTYLTVWPGGQSRPASSNLNVKARQTVANLVTVPVGTYQDLQIYNRAGQADVIVDFVGYYQPNAGQRFTPTGPSRLLDTRPSNGQADVRLTDGESRSVQVTGQAGVPKGASAVVLNLTATEPSRDGYLTAYPHGDQRPGVSNLNFTAGQTVANQAIVPIGSDGKIDLYNRAGDTQVIADVFGYYSYDSKGEFTPVTPTRLADTRPGNALGGDGAFSVQVGGAAGVPANATAAVLNVTATDTTASGFLTVWPDGGPRPATSNLNFRAGQTVPNHVITPLGGNGRVSIYNRAGRTQVIADLFGYFTNR
ncbi:PKD domain-containing protein [Kitasatospora sp. MAP5-34]|uniref:PKD domain-containing protein n=1 Tax=Kitasatospora sp. MAP5-34 TaxID=3035102 RepID=UPI0024754D3E|nr:PKD domain-containing protein [Kitasatospora sp. MAP5-34]MDH6577600.1 PKD repeat protein [Kitasatospora sp. MAP5-34]